MRKPPFVFGHSVSDEVFTDRVQDTQRLKTNFQYGQNTILIAPRGIGKTSLVVRAGRLVQSDTLRIASLDAFPFRSEAEFLRAFATEVLKATSSTVEERLRTVTDYLSRIVPEITIGADPSTDFGIGFDLGTMERNARDILDLPQKIGQAKGFKIVVCIDEFQQIGNFNNSLSFQKLLRSVWQLQTDVS